MKRHVLVLAGCAPTPLAHYLKALGVLRLVSEQRDPEARGVWKADVFHLASKLDSDALVRFVADELEPTPMVSPWNGGSGFYPKDNHAALDAIVAARSPRFARFARAITRAREEVRGRPERPAGDEKDALLAACSREWDEQALAWLTASVATGTDGAAKYPALLGTGGNDGRLDFTNNLMQRWVELVDVDTGQSRGAARALVGSALFGTVERGMVSAAIGQFHPGGAGGANAAPTFDADSSFNPWDYVLALEGALVLRVAALRKLDGNGASLASAPFALRGVAGGYSSATGADDDGRGEQWMPLWSGASTLAELERLFAEGRMLSGQHRARSALDAARAIAQLGVARGVTEFQRYGFMVRNGLANLAVPTTRVRTRETPAPDVRLLDELDQWLDALRRASESSHAPKSFDRAARRIQSLAFDIATAMTPSPRDWCALLEELGTTEDLFARSARFAVEAHLRPLPRLSSRWFVAADDGSIELRLAASVASAGAPPRSGKPDELGPIRAHCIPLDARFDRFAAGSEALHDDPRVVWTGGELAADLAKIVARRAMESQRAGYDGLALASATHYSLDEVSAFLLGRVDDARISRLARGLMCVKLPPIEPQPGRAMPLYAIFRLACLDAGAATGGALPKGVSARCDPQLIRLLATGRLEEAARIATARLGAMGLRPKLRVATGDARLSLRLAASLAIPIGPLAIRAAFDAVTKPVATTSTETP